MMQIRVEISLFPLNENYVPIVADFISRLRKHRELEIEVNNTSTLITGEHAKIFEILSKETAVTFASGKNVFVMKVLGFERNTERKY